MPQAGDRADLRNHDQLKLRLAPSEPGEGRILVALPFDERRDWYRVAPSLAEFLNRYFDSRGAKYWESLG
jgi:hypothetical protein